MISNCINESLSAKTAFTNSKRNPSYCSCLLGGQRRSNILKKTLAQTQGVFSIYYLGPQPNGIVHLNDVWSNHVPLSSRKLKSSDTSVLNYEDIVFMTLWVQMSERELVRVTFQQRFLESRSTSLVEGELSPSPRSYG